MMAAMINHEVAVDTRLLEIASELREWFERTSVQTSSTPVLPWLASTDRYAIHYGAAATVNTVSAALKTAEIGIRLSFCDLFSELCEGDTHLRSICSTRVKAVAGRPWDIKPAEVEPGDANGEKIAKTIADYVKAAIKRIPKWKTHVAGLLWGTFSGVSAREVMWDRTQDGEYRVSGLRFVHSRKLGYDWEWRLVWHAYGQSATGEPLRNYPAKFLVFEPSTWDEFPTREGLARTLVWWASFKRWDVRDLVAFIERFGKPYPQVIWKTGKDTADEADIRVGKKLAQDIGRGTLAGVAHPDVIDLKVTGNGSTAAGSGGSGENTPHKMFEALCDEQMSKLVLGQAYTTNSNQKTGLGNSGSPFENASQLLFVDDACQIEEAIDRDLIWWIVALNFGKDKADQYCPHYHIEIEDPEDADKIADRYAKLAKVGQPIKCKDVADRMGWQMPDPGDQILTVDGSTAFYQDPEEALAEKLEAKEQAKEDFAGGEEDDSEEPPEAPKAKPTKPAKEKPAVAKKPAKETPKQEGESAASGTAKDKSKPLPKPSKDGGTPKS